MYMFFFYCNKILIVLFELISTSYVRSFVAHGFLVSKETVVLRRWASEKNSVSFIKRVDKG